MHGSLPPSSSVTFFKRSAALAMTRLPVGVEPVSAIFRISGCSTIASPVAWPMTTLMTPSGRPPSMRASMQASVDRGVVLAGLSTTVFPAAIAGATLLAARVSGKFRHDGAANADRLAHHQSIGREVGQPDVLAVNLVGEVGEPADVLAEALGLEPRLQERLALLLGQDHRDLLDLAEHVLGGFVQNLAALVGGKPGPGCERFGRRLGGLVDVGRAAGGHLVDELACRRVADLIRFAGRSPRPLAFDDHRRHSGTPLRWFWLSR